VTEPGAAFGRFLASGRFFDEDAPWDDLATAARLDLVGPWAARSRPGRSLLLQGEAAFRRRLSVTCALVECLERAAIPCLVLKGVAAAAAWRVPWLRMQGDLDLLVGPAALAPSIAAWVRAGLVLAPAPDARGTPSGPASHHVRLELAQGPEAAVVELHTGFSIDFPVHASIDGLVAGRRWVEVLGRRLPTLAESVELAYLAMHAADHAATSARWLIDLAERARRGPRWDDAVATARAWRVPWPVWWALREARLRVGAEVPDRVLAALRPPARVRARLALLSRLPPPTAANFSARAHRLALLPMARWPGVVLRKLAARRPIA
jgi:hypothetical protein